MLSFVFVCIFVSIAPLPYLCYNISVPVSLFLFYFIEAAETISNAAKKHKVYFPVFGRHGLYLSKLLL